MTSNKSTKKSPRSRRPLASAGAIQRGGCVSQAGVTHNPEGSNAVRASVASSSDDPLASVVLYEESNKENDNSAHVHDVPASYVNTARMSLVEISMPVDVQASDSESFELEGEVDDAVEPSLLMPGSGPHAPAYVLTDADAGSCLIITYSAYDLSDPPRLAAFPSLSEGDREAFLQRLSVEDLARLCDGGLLSIDDVGGVFHHRLHVLLAPFGFARDDVLEMLKWTEGVIAGSSVLALLYPGMSSPGGLDFFIGSEFSTAALAFFRRNGYRKTNTFYTWERGCRANRRHMPPSKVYGSRRGSDEPVKEIHELTNDSHPNKVMNYPGRRNNSPSAILLQKVRGKGFPVVGHFPDGLSSVEKTGPSYAEEKPTSCGGGRARHWLAILLPVIGTVSTFAMINIAGLEVPAFLNFPYEPMKYSTLMSLYIFVLHALALGVRSGCPRESPHRKSIVFDEAFSDSYEHQLDNLSFTLRRLAEGCRQLILKVTSGGLHRPVFPIKQFHLKVYQSPRLPLCLAQRSLNPSGQVVERLLHHGGRSARIVRNTRSVNSGVAGERSWIDQGPTASVPRREKALCLEVVLLDSDEVALVSTSAFALHGVPLSIYPARVEERLCITALGVRTSTVRMQDKFKRSTGMDSRYASTTSSRLRSNTPQNSRRGLWLWFGCNVGEDVTFSNGLPGANLKFVPGRHPAQIVPWHHYLLTAEFPFVHGISSFGYVPLGRKKHSFLSEKSFDLALHTEGIHFTEPCEESYSDRSWSVVSDDDNPLPATTALRSNQFAPCIPNFHLPAQEVARQDVDVAEFTSLSLDAKRNVASALPIDALARLVKSGGLSSSMIGEALLSRSAAYFATFNLDVAEVLLLLKWTESILAGQVVLAIMFPGLFVPNHIDIYVGVEFEAIVLSYLRGRGYVSDHVIHPSASYGSADPLPAHLAYRPYFRPTEQSEVARLHEVTDPSGRKVVVIVTLTVPIFPLLRSPSTLTMNYVAYHGFVVLHPLTLSRVGLKAVPDDEITPGTQLLYDRYNKWGFHHRGTLPGEHDCNADLRCPQASRSLFDDGVAHFLFPLYANNSGSDGAVFRRHEASILRWRLATALSCGDRQSDRHGFILCNSRCSVVVYHYSPSVERLPEFQYQIQSGNLGFCSVSSPAAAYNKSMAARSADRTSLTYKAPSRAHKKKNRFNQRPAPSRHTKYHDFDGALGTRSNAGHAQMTGRRLLLRWRSSASRVVVAGISSEWWRTPNTPTLSSIREHGHVGCARCTGIEPVRRLVGSVRAHSSVEFSTQLSLIPQSSSSRLRRRYAVVVTRPGDDRIRWAGVGLDVDGGAVRVWVGMARDERGAPIHNEDRWADPRARARSLRNDDESCGMLKMEATGLKGEGGARLEANRSSPRPHKDDHYINGLPAGQRRTHQSTTVLTSMAFRHEDDPSRRQQRRHSDTPHADPHMSASDANDEEICRERLDDTDVFMHNTACNDGPRTTRRARLDAVVCRVTSSPEGTPTVSDHPEATVNNDNGVRALPREKDCWLKLGPELVVVGECCSCSTRLGAVESRWKGGDGGREKVADNSEATSARTTGSRTRRLGRGVIGGVSDWGETSYRGLSKSAPLSRALGAAIAVLDGAAVMAMEGWLPKEPKPVFEDVEGDNDTSSGAGTPDPPSPPPQL
ncbi:hypothetical protein DFP72DRAFT_861999 [Ephemerocybe angulata]|uniref:Uncharacterized protein n=1 Tax=Ephemerocybe angulata TaxID=980116 RepID=A0A8H6LUG4_9AGAR|nr:hypothetical protein DFP72DRAFT_861999 [Tulosesus angulatus]